MKDTCNLFEFSMTGGLTFKSLIRRLQIFCMVPCQQNTCCWIGSKWKVWLALWQHILSFTSLLVDAVDEAVSDWRQYGWLISIRPLEGGHLVFGLEVKVMEQREQISQSLSAGVAVCAQDKYTWQWLQEEEREGGRQWGHDWISCWVLSQLKERLGLGGGDDLGEASRW